MIIHFRLAVIVSILVLGIFDISAYSPYKRSDKQTQTSDVEVVSNPKEPVPEPGKRKRIVFIEELTIGESEGDENYMFGEIVEVIADEEGCFYVTDWDRKRVQKFSPKGEYILSIGRKDQEPCEFGNIWSPAFDKEGNLYATDIVNTKGAFLKRMVRYLKVKE